MIWKLSCPVLGGAEGGDTLMPTRQSANKGFILKLTLKLSIASNKLDTRVHGISFFLVLLIISVPKFFFVVALILPLPKQFYILHYS